MGDFLHNIDLFIQRFAAAVIDQPAAADGVLHILNVKFLVHRLGHGGKDLRRPPPPQALIAHRPLIGPHGRKVVG